LAVELVAEFKPSAIWLFGSVARGDDDADSDLDVLVVLDRYHPNDAMELKGRALRATTVPAPFDVTFTDGDRMATLQRIAGTVERAVLLDGRCLYRRD
jgi:predicted nucleotidyltransferase